jgi:putative phage-type endonuclease
MKKFKEIDLIQGTDEWLKYRMTKITASEIAVIMGNSPYQTKRELYFEKVSKKIPEADPSKEYIFSKGHAVEELIRQEYFMLTGAQMKPLCVESIEYPQLFASLDGFYEEEERPLEAKLVGKNAIEKAKTEKEDIYKVPQHHYDQLQFQMLVTGCDVMDYFCHDGNKSGVLLTFSANKEYQEILKTEALVFMDMVKDKIEPELTDRDVLLIKDKEIRAKAKKLKALKAKLDKLEEQYSKIEGELKTNPPHSKVECEGILISKIETSGSVDYKKIPELKNIDLDKYRGPSRTSWRLTFKKEA